MGEKVKKIGRKLIATSKTDWKIWSKNSKDLKENLPIVKWVKLNKGLVTHSIPKIKLEKRNINKANKIKSSFLVTVSNQNVLKSTVNAFPNWECVLQNVIA